MRRIGSFIASFTLLFFLMAGAVPAIPWAEFTLSESGSGSVWSYGLSITNTSTEGENLYAFDMLFPRDILFTGISLPSGWEGVSWMGEQQTTSPDAFSTEPLYDILPAVTLDGFEFKTDTRLSGLAVTYEAWYTDPTPSAVPEPSTWLLLSVGLTGIFFARRKRNG